MGVKRFPRLPAQPQRLCWGCDRLCASNDMLCGNGSVRTPHPSELFGPDWDAVAVDKETLPARPNEAAPAPDTPWTT